MMLTPYLSDLQWQGGEPFVLNHKYFQGLIERAAKNPHLSQNIITNGLLIDRPWAELLVRHGVQMRISIDGATKEIYEKIRTGAKWERLIESIELLNEARDRQNKRTSLELHMVVMKSNHHQLPEMIDFAHKYRFDVVDFSHIVFGAGVDDHGEDIFGKGDRRTWAVLKEGRAKAKERALACGIRFGDNLPFPPPESSDGGGSGPADTDGDRAHRATETPPANDPPMEPFFCLSPWKQIIIREDGHVITNWHCFDKGRHKNIGHCERQSLLQAWNGPFMRTLRRRTIDRTQRGLCAPFCLSGALIDAWRDHIEWI